MKNFVIFFPTQKKIQKPFDFLRPQLELQEMQMLSRIPQSKVNIFIVRNLENYLGGNVFIPQFQLRGDTWQVYKTTGEIHGDLIYGFKMPKDISHTYPSKISEITIDKRVIENIFPHLALRSYICDNHTDIENNFHKIQTRLKVLKPVHGTRGRGVFISENIPPDTDIDVNSYPYILQEFFDTSGGFYNYCMGIHDFRIVILNGEIIGKILRTPQAGSYISNTGQGGEIQDLWDFKIPQEIQSVIDEVEAYCSDYTHRYYSIDMGIGKDGEIKIFELNGAPALSNEYIAHKFGDYTAKYILGVI